jgi:hypothetical protein
MKFNILICYLQLLFRFDITGFPTIKFFPAGSAKEPVNYESAREVDAMTTFLNEKAGTFRDPKTGGLVKSAGRLQHLDNIISEAAEYGHALVAELEKAIEGNDHPSVKTYISYAKKIAEKGEEFIKTESARLTGMIKSAAVSNEKKTGFFLKSNILNAFLKADKNDKEL